MKKFYTTFIIAIFTIKLFASINVYAPTLVAPINNAVNQMPNALLNWSPVSGSFGLHYKVQLDFDSLFSNPQTLTTNFTAINVSELKFGNQYFWRVKAIDNSDSSSWSAIRAFTVIRNVVLKPMSTTPTWSCYMLNDSLMWQPISGVTYYDYQIDTIASFNSSSLVFDSVVGSKDRVTFQVINALHAMYSNTTYYWRVRARHNKDISIWSQLGTFTVCNAMPNAPALYSPSNMAVNQLDTLWLNWVPLHNAEHYNIQYDINSNFPNPTTLNFIPLTSNINDVQNSKIFISGLSSNQTYYWRVNAINGFQSTLWSEVWSFTTISSTVPGLIEPLNNAINLDPKVALEWTSVPTAVSYWVEYSTDNLFANSDTLTSISNTNILNNLLFSTTYYWRVKTLTANDTSVWSITYNFTIVDSPSLLTPIDIATNQNLNIPLTWTSMQGITSYECQLDTSMLFNSPVLIDSLILNTISSISLDTLQNSTTYYWRLKAMHTLDTSSWSLVWSFTTIDSMPTAPLLLSPIDLAIDQMPEVLLKWTPVSGATTYLVEYSDDNLFANSTTIHSTTSSYSVDSLLFATPYFWRVKAIGANDTSAWSNEFSFTVIDVVPLNSPANSSANQMPDVLLEWTPLTGVYSYIVEYDTDNFFSNPTSETTVNTSIQTQNLKFGETYFWRVKAISSVDTTNWSLVYTLHVIDNLTLLSPIDASNQLLAVIMTWETISGVSLYECQVDTSASFDSGLLKNIIVSSDLPLVQAYSEQTEFGAVYYWRVRAIHAVDTTNWSLVWSFTTSDIITLAMPINGAIEIMPNESLRCFYFAGASNYQFELDTTPLFNSLAYLLSYADNNLPFAEAINSELYFGTKYYWRGRARIGASYSSWSSVWNFTTVEKVILTSPLNNTNILIKNPLLKWKAIDGITNYVLWLDTSATFSNPVIYNVNITSTDTTQYTVLSSALVPFEKYYWKVKAVHSKDETVWSDVRNFNYDYGVGIEDNSSVVSTRIFPNPSNGNIAIEVNINNSCDAMLQILDITGRTVYNEILSLKQGQNIKTMNLSFLSQGIYIVNIKNEKINLNKKLILDN